jgi:hypothetical protein
MEKEPIIECKGQGTCSECLARKIGVFITSHHRFHPAKLYRTPLEKEFRNHPDNMDFMAWCEHSELHATTKPPEKPPLSHMRAFLFKERGRNGK